MPEELENNAVDLLGGDEQQTTETQETQTTTESQSQSAPFDAAALSAALGPGIADAIKNALPRQQQEPKQLSPEEIKKQLNVWDPDDTFVQEFGNLETQKAAWAKHRDALIRQADTITQIRLAAMREEMEKMYEEKYGPVLQQFTKQQEREVESRFNTTYPDLAKKEYAPLLTGVAQQLKASGKKYTKEEEFFTDLAKGAEAVIKTVAPNFTLSQGSKTTTGSTRNAIPVTTGGGGGGGGRSGGGGAPKGGNLALSILAGK